ncbi:hypothetical protein B296_00054759 [Ensete ventricosum]|uniref:Uncharacterized protein n=1 Tax=Ensete ventricosum TaxID=4639 RepID=A0A426XWR3_ENSVE|nr:hypothetical protein B296_00054759 [Ensete ventricosum]
MGGTYWSVRLPVRGPPATGWFGQKSTVGDRFRPSVVDFSRRRPIEEEIDRRRSIEREIDSRRSIEREIDRWRSIEEEKGKKRRKKKKKEERIPRPHAILACLPSPPAGRLCAVAAHDCDRFFSCARRRSVSPRGEKDQDDVDNGRFRPSLPTTERYPPGCGEGEGKRKRKRKKKRENLVS